MTQSNSDTKLLHPAPRLRYTVVFLYAIAMAWVEAAVVYYLRTMVDRIQPYQEMPLPLIGGLSAAELIREAATLVMLLTVGWLAGWNLRNRLAYSLIAFGVWDIFYYVFLRAMTGWPQSLLDWDILFLLPLPWWGPVLAPVLIAILMIAWGTLVVFDRENSESTIPWTAWYACVTGTALALYVFMADALKVADQGTEAVRRVLPASFPWGLYLLALALMSAPVMFLLLKRTQGRKRGQLASLNSVSSNS